MRLVLLGPPGAGKGTLANLLKEDLKITHISTGDILREEMKNKTTLGRRVKSYVERGDLVPDEVVTKIIEQRFQNSGLVHKGFMLDGFPRTKAQSEDLDRILASLDKPLDYALYFEADLEVIIQRLTGRLVCRTCGALFHATNRPPKKNGVCDVCRGPLYQRPDDNEETIKARMAVYAQNTEPIIVYYEGQQKLLRINANRDAVEVRNELRKTFQKDPQIDSHQVERRN